MHRNVVLVTLLVGACASREESVVIASASGAAAIPIKPDPIAKGVPHSSAIVAIAATDEGDAALTADAINGIRLWPALDGTRTPVPVTSTSQPSELALLHAGRDLVAVVLDSAGAVTITRLGLDGSVRGRTQLPGGTSYAEAVAVGSQILVRTTDHALELYQPDGTLRGRLTAEHGIRVTDLATRRGRAAAVALTNEAYQLRWLRVGETLAWDTEMRLPLNPLDGMLAIAPGRRRIAFVDVGATGLHVYDADLMPVPVAGTAVALNGAQVSLGFIDDNTVGASGSSLVWWTAAPAVVPPADPDPWAVAPTIPPPQLARGSTAAVFVDGQMIAPFNLALALTEPKRTRFLGWKHSMASAAATAGDHVAIASNSYQFTWLDENLAMTHRINLQEHRTPNDAWIYGTAISDHHLLTQTYRGDQIEIAVVDSRHPGTPLVIGKFKNLERHEYVDGMVAVVAGRQIHRFKVDLDANTAIKLEPSLRVTAASPTWIRLFDPDRAGGLVAAVQGWDQDDSSRQSLTIYRQTGTKITRAKVNPFDHQLLRSDATGRLFFLDYTTSRSILVMRGTEIQSRITRPEPLTLPISVNKLGTQFAVRDNHDIVMIDAAGNEQWRKTLWGATSFTFAGGGNRLVVGAPGGFVAYDAATGEERAKECGWNFGLHDTAPEAQGTTFASVCEDPIVQ